VPDRNSSPIVHHFTISNEVTSLLVSLNRGIGLETSLLFASEGANVLLVDINIKAAETVAALITTRHPHVKAIAIKTDVGVEKEIKDAVDFAVEEFGRLDIMVRLPFPLCLPTRMVPLPLASEITIRGFDGLTSPVSLHFVV